LKNGSGYLRFLPPGLPVRLGPEDFPLKLDFHPADEDLSAGAPDLEKPPGLGLEWELKPGLGFQPGPAFLAAREAELG
jgi:hypothetical protein